MSIGLNTRYFQGSIFYFNKQTAILGLPSEVFTVISKLELSAETILKNNIHKNQKNSVCFIPI